MKTSALQTLFKTVVIKQRLQHKCFPVNIEKFLKTTLFKKICEWLLLNLTVIRNLTIQNHAKPFITKKLRNKFENSIRLNL